MKLHNPTNVKQLIQEWNKTRLDIFHIKEPDDGEDFYGVIRFYYVEEDGRVCTKCLRVSSSANVQYILRLLVEKFRPDLKTLSSEFCLYEVYADGEERLLETHERPLLLQLNWCKSQRDGRFLLRNAAVGQTSTLGKAKTDLNSDRRKNVIESAASSSLYRSVPEKFSRSLSNPELMKRIKQQRLKKKYDEMENSDKSSTIKVFADVINPVVPYKTVLLSVQDTALFVLNEVLEKYGMCAADHSKFCLIKVLLRNDGSVYEEVLDDDENPLQSLLLHDPCAGVLMFRVVNRPYVKFAAYLIQASAEGKIYDQPYAIRLNEGRTDVGSRKQPHQMYNYFHLINEPGIESSHCYFKVMPGGSSIIFHPLPGADSFINGVGPIRMPTALSHGNIIGLGKSVFFKLIHPRSQPKLNVLPCLLELPEEFENQFIANGFSFKDPPRFRLAPTFASYMIIRHRLSPYFYSPSRGLESAVIFVDKVSDTIQNMVNNASTTPAVLAMLLANASELLNLIKRDRELSTVTSSYAQVSLTQSVRMAFHSLSCSLQSALQRTLPAYLNPASPDEEKLENASLQEMPSLGCSLRLLSSTMALLRRCRINAAFTIQMFSQLFRFINAWLMNHLLLSTGYGLRVDPFRFAWRLKKLHEWATQQGLELAADCHLGQITQAATVLCTPNRAHVNSDLLTRSQLNTLLNLNCSQAFDDESNKEDITLHLPLLIPEGGYACESIVGIPSGLIEFIEPHCSSDLCRLLTNDHSLGRWTEFLNASPLACNPMELVLHKKQGGLGLSIVAARGDGQMHQGIYIKSIVSGGAAENDGRLEAGDQLLSVNGVSLINVSQEEAAAIMTGCGSVVTLTYAKRAAEKHGLAQLLFPTSTKKLIGTSCSSESAAGANSSHSPLSCTGHENFDSMEENSTLKKKYASKYNKKVRLERNGNIHTSFKEAMNIKYSVDSLYDNNNPEASSENTNGTLKAVRAHHQQQQQQHPFVDESIYLQNMTRTITPNILCVNGCSTTNVSDDIQRQLASLKLSSQRTDDSVCERFEKNDNDDGDLRTTIYNKEEFLTSRQCSDGDERKHSESSSRNVNGHGLSVESDDISRISDHSVPCNIENLIKTKEESDFYVFSDENSAVKKITSVKNTTSLVPERSSVDLNEMGSSLSDDSLQTHCNNDNEKNTHNYAYKSDNALFALSNSSSDARSVTIPVKVVHRKSNSDFLNESKSEQILSNQRTVDGTNEWLLENGKVRVSERAQLEEEEEEELTRLRMEVEFGARLADYGDKAAAAAGEVVDKLDMLSRAWSRDVASFASYTDPVIGTQEIYNDPRQRLKCTKRAETKNASDGENMTFEQKMRFFANSSSNQNAI